MNQAELNYHGFSINYSKLYKNKISLFKGNQFFGDFYYIIEAKHFVKVNFINN